MAKNGTNQPDETQDYVPISDEAKAKSEAVRELFDFPREKLPQRTRLNLKEIQTFALIKANMEILNPDEDRLWPILYLQNIMELKISLGGEGRREGMTIFQSQQEANAFEEALKP
jgi:hypothetical protein